MSIGVENVSYYYPGSTEPSVDDVTVTVHPGEVVAIVGPNGSGKSTLGRLMKGLVLPRFGAVTVDGLDTQVDDLAVRRLVGLLFQNPNSQIVNAVVEHEVAFGPENIGMAPAAIRERVDEALEAVGMTGQETAQCHDLGMADKQRVALASVLAMHPRYLILDEPTAWIEPAARWNLLDEVLSRGRERSMGIALITHRMDEAQVADRLYGILAGQIVAEGKPAEVLGDAAIRRRLSLDVPDAYELASDLRDAGLPVSPGEPVPHMAEALWRS
ncbi:MAG TPA: ATP-binding cassette domain-containing protein [Chloroflexota bacterium]|nr:ATP-binding cassette domain-containing protein [Chloroflexota bacterium]